MRVKVRSLRKAFRLAYSFAKTGERRLRAYASHCQGHS